MASSLAVALGVAQTPKIYTDNDAVARMAFDEMSVKRALHIMRRLAWLQERVAGDDFTVEHLPGSYMVADMNTKICLDSANFSLFMGYLYGSPKNVEGADGGAAMAITEPVEICDLFFSAGAFDRTCECSWCGYEWTGCMLPPAEGSIYCRYCEPQVCYCRCPYPNLD